MRNVCRVFSAILLLATGCTYNPVRYDPVSGFQTGGGVGVLCGGPLDPWMHHCCPQCGCAGPCACGPCTTPGNQCCPDPCAPVPVCPPVCAPVCPPVCPPAPVCPPPGVPMGFSGGPMIAAPVAAPGVFSAPPVPTFAAPCPTCGPTPSAGIPGPPQTYGSPYPATTNYSQLFHAPPMAPPAMPYGDQFVMPAPLNPSEYPPAAQPMPPHYDAMETPAKQPAPAAPEPTSAGPMPMPKITPMDMNPKPMHTQPAPMKTQPMPMQPTPVTPEAMHIPSPQIMMPAAIQQGVLPPGATPYIDSRRPEGNHIRL